MADRNGYIGRAPGDSAVQVARQDFTPTGVQTNFTFDAGYTPGYLDVYLNGSKLVVAQDFTATDGSVVGLTSAAASGDIIELVAFKAFNAASVNNAGTLTVSGNQTNNGTLSVTGGTTLSNLNVSGISTLGTVSGLDLNGSVLTLDADGDTTITADTDDQIDIAFGGNDRITLSTGLIDLKNDGSQSAIRFYCESSNAHYAALQAPAHSAFSGNITLTLPATTDTLVARTTTDTLTNKTLTSPTISTPTLTGGVGIADSIFHTGDDNTQIRFPAADTFTVETAGSERIRVTSAGLVGIGSDTPSRMLVVSGADPIIRSEDSDNVSDFAEFKQLTGVLYIDTRNGASDGTIVFRGVGGGSATEKLRIDSAGDMGLGVTPNNVGSQRTLHIKGPSGEGAAIRLQDNGDTADSDDFWVYKNSSAAYLRVNGTDPLRFYLNGAERMQLDSSGRLSIANDTPGSFDAGADDLVIGSSSGDRGITIYTGSSDQGNLYFADGTSGAQQYAGGINYGHSDNQLRFLSNGSTRMRLDSSGRLLHGVTSSSSNISAVFQGNSDNSASAAGILLQRGTATPADGAELGNLYFADSAAGTGAIILAKRDGGTWSGSSKPGRIEFWTTPDGATSGNVRFTVGSDGVVTAARGAVCEIDTLTSASTVTPDFAASCNFTLTLGHNVTLANPSNLTAGQSGSIFLIQDGTGSRTITFGNQYDFAGGTAPTLSTAASSVDRLDYFVRTSSSIHCVVTLAYS